jgi:cell division protein FtsB
MQRRRTARRQPATLEQLGLAIAAVVFLYIAVNLIGAGLRAVMAQGELRKLTADIATLQEENARLRSLVEDMRTDQYVERMARSELLYGYPGEKMIIPVVESSPTPTVHPTSSR